MGRTDSRRPDSRRPEFRGRGLSGLIVGAGLFGALLAGCTSTSAAQGSIGPAVVQPGPAATAPAAGPTATAPATTAPARTSSARTGSARPSSATIAVTSTVTRTKPGLTIKVGPPKATPEPAPAAGDCPYLSPDIVSFITGQHHGQTQLVTLAPQPMCVFYRSDGGWMGSVRVIKAASPQAAVAAVNQHVPIADSQPASQPAGWTGGSTTTPGQMTQDSSARSVYAVSKGDIAIVAEEDESPSIKARVMASCAIYGLRLEAGPAPAYCSGSEG